MQQGWQGSEQAVDATIGQPALTDAVDEDDGVTQGIRAWLDTFQDGQTAAVFDVCQLLSAGVMNERPECVPARNDQKDHETDCRPDTLLEPCDTGCAEECHCTQGRSDEDEQSESPGASQQRQQQPAHQERA